MIGVPRHGDIDSRSVSLETTSSAPTSAARSRIRSILASRATSRQQLRQVGLVVLLLPIFGTELIAGIVLLASPDSSTSAQVIGYALVVSLLVGVARSWELVGARGGGLIASIMTLAAGRLQVRDDKAGDPDGAVSSGSEDSPGNELLRTESGE